MSAPSSRHANRTWVRKLERIDAEIRWRIAERERLEAEGDHGMAQAQRAAIDELLAERFEAMKTVSDKP